MFFQINIVGFVFIICKNCSYMFKYLLAYYVKGRTIS